VPELLRVRPTDFVDAEQNAWAAKERAETPASVDPADSDAAAVRRELQRLTVRRDTWPGRV